MRDLRQQPFYDVIKEYDNWLVLFRGRQVTIGSVIIMAKDITKTSLGDVPPEVWAEFGVVCKNVERWISDCFGAEKFNYLALMMKYPEVHFHVIPRYPSSVEFLNQTFTDVDWPVAPKLVALELDDDTTKAIYNKILEATK